MFAASLSEHPIPATAVGEIAGYLIESIGEQADLMCAFVTPHHAGALEDIAAALHTILDPKVFIGCAASGVIGTGREIQNSPAISVWAGNVGPVQPLRLDVISTPNGRAIDGWPLQKGSVAAEGVPAGAVLLADPFSFPVGTLFGALNSAGGFPRVVGGMASSGPAPGTNRLILDGEVHDSGAVGVLIGANNSTSMQTVVSQGCRPIGAPLVITRSEGNVIYELAGESALARLTSMLKTDLTPEDLILARDGLLIGAVIDEHKAEFELGDFLVRTFIDADPSTGAITVGERVEVGTTIQFQLRDSDAADLEFRHLLSEQSARGSLLFSCNGRGEAMFGLPHHDAEALGEMLDDPPTAGFFAAGEFGPIGGMNYVHGFTASIALFS